MRKKQKSTIESPIQKMKEEKKSSDKNQGRRKKHWSLRKKRKKKRKNIGKKTTKKMILSVGDLTALSAKESLAWGVSVPSEKIGSVERLVRAAPLLIRCQQEPLAWHIHGRQLVIDVLPDMLQTTTWIGHYYLCSLYYKATINHIVVLTIT